MSEYPPMASATYASTDELDVVTEAIDGCLRVLESHSRSLDGLFDSVLSLYRWIAGLIVALLATSCALVVVIVGG